MILKIKMQSDSNDKIILPINYNHIVQGFIYDSLNKDLSQFLHEKGFKHHKRYFKMFTFSRLMGFFNLDREKGEIQFTGPIYLTIASPVEGFFNSLAHTFFIGNKIRLGKNYLQVVSIEGEKVNVQDDEIIIQTLSPIVSYSTFLRPDKRKYTCYFQPQDPDYNRLIGENLKKKYMSFLNIEPPIGDIRIKNISAPRQVIINYKNTIIKGYNGRLKITGPKEILKIALEAGIGSKNSQGFGCVKLIEA